MKTVGKPSISSSMTHNLLAPFSAPICLTNTHWNHDIVHEKYFNAKQPNFSSDATNWFSQGESKLRAAMHLTTFIIASVFLRNCVIEGARKARKMYSEKYSSSTGWRRSLGGGKRNRGSPRGLVSPLVTCPGTFRTLFLFVIWMTTINMRQGSPATAPSLTPGTCVWWCAPGGGTTCPSVRSGQVTEY